MMPTSRIPYDPTGSDIVLITYPPGGFGNFIYYLLTEFTDQTVKPNNSSFAFSNAGNSHSTRKYTVTYSRDPVKYFPLIDSDVIWENKTILVLVDNAWQDNEYARVQQVFPNAKIVRMCSDPSIYNIVAALIASKTQGVPIDLRYRDPYDGTGKFAPLTQDGVVNVSIKDFMLDPFDTFYKLVTDLGLTVIRTEELHIVFAKWRKVHKPYFEDLYKEFHKAHLL